MKELAIQYIVTTILSLVLLCYIYNSVRNEPSTMVGQSYLVKAIFFTIVFALADIVYAVREFNVVDMNTTASYASEMIYSLASIVSAYFWFLFSETRQNAEYVKSKRKQILHSIPLFVIALFTITTPIHHLCFSFDGSNHYVRGILNTPFTAIVALFIVVTGIKGYVMSFDKRYYTQRKKLRSLSLYAVLLIITQGIQIAVGSIMPFRTIGAAIVFFIIREIHMLQSITLDGLTKINNRSSLESHLSTALENAGNNFFFMMIDLDDFKSINDKFGHVEGDNALCIFSEALQLTAKSDVFISRYGGDEFSADGNVESEDQIDSFIENLCTNLETVSSKYNNQLPISFSYGYVMKTPEINTVPDIIMAADRKLYEMKKLKKTSD